jgi:hypothetical protein
MSRWTKTVAERFAEKVKPVSTGCHEWTGALAGSFGYGVLRIDGRNTRAHRYAWEQAHGPLTAGEHVLHHCDNPRCVRVDHLFLGDHAANAHDASAKGRLGNAKAKLTAAEVREAFAMRERGETYEGIAKRFNLSSGGAWQLLNESRYARRLVSDQKPKRMRCTMTDDEVEAAKEMRDGGATWQATADAIGVDMTTLFNRIPDRNGYRHKITAEHLDTVRAAVAQGETIKAASARLGLTYKSVVDALKNRKGTGEPPRSGYGGWRPGSGRKARSP